MPTQEEEKEYPIIEFKDMKAGDLVQDPSGNLYVYYNQDFYDTNGVQLRVNKELKYRLVQKRRYIRPLDAFFYAGNGLVSSFENGTKWFSACAKLGQEPEIVKRCVFAPNCQYIEALFNTKSDALDYIASKQEPQLHALVVNSDCKYVVTQYFTNTGFEIQSQKDLNKLEAELAKEKSEKEQILLEFKRLQETNLVNEKGKNELSAQVTSHKQMIELLKGDLASRDQEIKLLKKYRDQLVLEHKFEIQVVCQSLKATKEQYEANLTAKDEAFSTLQLQATYIENHRDKLLEDLEESRKKFETCEDHRQFLLKKVDEELQKVAFSNQQLQRVLAEKDELRHKLNNSLEQAKSLVGATQEVSKLKDLVADLMEKNEELKGSLQILETKRVQLQYQLEREEGVSTKWHQEAVTCRQKLEKLSALVNLHA